MNAHTVIKEFIKRQSRVPELGERSVIAHWLRDEDGPFIDNKRYGELLTMLPDKIVENLERARLAQLGRIPMVKAGLGYEELLSSVIVDGTAIASSSAEARLFPAILIPKNFMAPGGIPGRTFKATLRGRATTLTTAATMTFRWRDGATDVFTNTLAASGAITMDVTVQTATMWLVKAEGVVRAVGSAGSIFCMGDSEMAAQALTLANNTANFLGSAGSATPAAVAIDTTSDRFWNFTGQWSLATAYSIQGHEYLLECLN